MAIPLKGLEDLTGESAAAAVGFGLGVALSEALRPLATKIAYEAWATAPIRVPDPGTLAAGVAQGQVDEDAAREWAKNHGYDDEAFSALIDIANVGPAIGLAFEARRRGELTDAQLRTAFRRTGLEEQWDAAMLALVENRLDLGAIATAIHRGIMAGEGLIVREPPQTPGEVPHVPQSHLDATEEAAAHGIDPERLRILVGNTGLPPGLMEMLHLLNRHAVTEDDVRRAVAQSNLRNEYMDVVLELRRQLLTPHEYEEAALRGIITQDAADAGAELHGMTRGDARLLFETMGRPLAVRAITTGLARGGQLGGSYDDVPEPYRDAIRRSNIRPEYARLAYANRYTLPSTFVLRGMAQAGELNQQETETLLLQSGWQPALAAKVAARWAAGGAAGGKAETLAQVADEYEGGFATEAEYRASLEHLGYTGAAADRLVHLGDARRVKRYREKAIDAIGKAYVGFKLSDERALAELEELHVAGEAAELLLTVWSKQRLDTIRELTPAQIAKAYKHNLITRDVALEALEWEHYEPADAAILLDE